MLRSQHKLNKIISNSFAIYHKQCAPFRFGAKLCWDIWCENLPDLWSEPFPRAKLHVEENYELWGTDIHRALRFEYEIEYNFSILICRLRIIMSHIPISFHELPSLPQSNINRMALETSLVWKSKVIILLNLIHVVKSEAL